MIKFQVFELDYAMSFLYKLKLVDYSSRMRTRFIKILSKRHQQFQEEYLELVKEHAVPDQNGNLEIISDGQSIKYRVKDQDLFYKSLKPLLDEEFIIQIDENNKNMIKSVAKSILNCGLEFEGEEQFRYDVLAEKFENLDFGDDSV